MKGSLLAGAFCSFFLAGAAGAADLPLKAPANPTPATSPWTGFYIGGGFGFRASQTSETSDFTSRGGRAPQPPTPIIASSEPLNGIALRGSAFAGYNWQVTRQWVLGIEGDLGFADQTTTFAGRPFPDQSFSSFVASDGIAAKTTWDASVRARFGFLVTPSALVYATTGAAWQHYEISTTCRSFVCTDFLVGFPGGPFLITPAVTNNSTTKPGWTIGGGIETALGGHWFARADYRYADFGSSTFTITRFSTFLPFNPIANAFDVALRTHTVGFGLAYKFGDEVVATGAPAGWLDALPVKAPSAKATVSSSWNGLYTGLGLGLRSSGTDATTTSASDPVLGFGAGVAASEPIGGTAFRSAPYLGVNWQIAPRWLVGIEGDFGFANQSTSLEGFGFSPGVFAFELNKSDTFAVRTTWDASARGRVGFLVTPALLAYGTAGAAWQHFTVASTCDSLACGGLAPAVVTESTTRAGWTMGAGLESMLSGNWFARAEYRFADFRPTSLTLTRQDGVGNPVSTSFDVGLRTHTATFGISYKFSGAAPPI